MKNKQYIYKFSKNGVDGNKKLINILGGKGANLAEIGRLLEVSRERVRQVELKALRKLRNLVCRIDIINL